MYQNNYYSSESCYGNQVLVYGYNYENIMEISEIRSELYQISRLHGQHDKEICSYSQQESVTVQIYYLVTVQIYIIL